MRTSVPVSVVIPAYNAEAWLERSVASALGSGADQVVIVDDASSDNTQEVGAALAAGNSRVSFRKLSKNLGAAAARLEAVQFARHDWIAPLDSDDYFDPNAVLTAFNKAVSDSAEICLFTMLRVEGDKLTCRPDLSAFQFPMAGREAARLTLGGWRIHSQGVIRRSAFLAASKRVMAVKAFNSDELVTRELFMRCRRITACEAGYYYVMNPKSTTRTKAENTTELARSDSWLLAFALENGFLREDPWLADSMIQHGLMLADRLRLAGEPSEAESLVATLRECFPPISRTWRKELSRTVRGRGSRQRLRALRRWLETSPPPPQRLA